MGLTALSYDEDIHDSLLKHFFYITHAYVYIPFPNNPTAYTRVTMVSIVGVTVTVCFLVMLLMPFPVKSTFQESLKQNTQETYIHWVAIVAVTALSYDEDVQCNHCC